MIRELLKDKSTRAKRRFISIFLIGLFITVAYALANPSDTYVEFQDLTNKSDGNKLNGLYSGNLTVWSAKIGGTNWYIQNLTNINISQGDIIITMNLSKDDIDFSANPYVELCLSGSCLSPRKAWGDTGYTGQANKTFYWDNVDTFNRTDLINIDDILGLNYTTLDSRYVEQNEYPNLDTDNTDDVVEGDANKTLVYCGNITGSTSNLCTLTDTTIPDTTLNMNTSQFNDNTTIKDSYINSLDDDTTYTANNPFLYLAGTTFHFNESQLTTTYHNANSSVVMTGIINGGTISDTQHPDGSYDGVTLNFTEASGSPGLDLRINFTGINDFNKGFMRYEAENIAGEYPVVQLWDYMDSEWEEHSKVAETSSFSIMEVSVFNSARFIQNRTVQMRIYKASNGNTGNHYRVDWIAIASGYGTPSGDELDPFSIHRDGSVLLTDNWDAGDYNITTKVFKGDWSGNTSTNINNLFTDDLTVDKDTRHTMNTSQFNDNTTIKDSYVSGFDTNTDIVQDSNFNATIFRDESNKLGIVLSFFRGLFYDSESDLTALLDDDYVDVDENPSAGDISGTFSTGLSIGGNKVQLAELDVSDVSDDIAGDIAEGELANDIIVEADLKSVNEPIDEDIFTYESTTGEFEWHTPAELITAGTGISWSGTTLNLDNDFSSSIDDTEMTAEDFGEFTCTGNEDGCTLDTGTFDDEYIELGDSFGGEVSGTYNAITIGNDVLDDQYYDSESDLTALLDDDYVDIDGDTMTGNLTFGSGSIDEVTNVELVDGAKISGNSTCGWFTSPDGTTRIEICN